MKRLLVIVLVICALSIVLVAEAAPQSVISPTATTCFDCPGPPTKTPTMPPRVQRRRPYRWDECPTYTPTKTPTATATPTATPGTPRPPTPTNCFDC